VGSATADIDTLTLLLPPRERLHGELPLELARLLGRSERLADAATGREAQLLRHFDLLPRRIPVAPLTRELDAGDGRVGAWLRADPAHVRADMASARMLACGDLGLTVAEAETLVASLRVLFGDEGFPISAPVPSRWYLMLPAQSRLPAFAAPQDVLGDDLHAHMPAGDDGRRWRRLLNEAQVILHNHPLNARRIAAGRLPVNSLWFWGAGTLPDHVRAPGLRVASDDPLLRALAALASISAQSPEPARLASADGPNLIDLSALRNVAELDAPWLEAALQALPLRGGKRLLLDFADGCRHEWRLGWRWRFWRRPARSLA
jgi:hypothetical protein